MRFVSFGLMKWFLWVGTLCLWAQVESRDRGRKLPPPKASPAPRPTPVEVSYIIISGTITDPNHDPVSEARVWIVDHKSGKVLAETQADKRGNFGFAIPKVDTLILRVSKDDKFYERIYARKEVQNSDIKVVFDPQ